MHFDLLELHVRDQVFPLTLMEANLLRFLIEHQGKPVPRKAMLEEVWGLHEDTDTRAIDNFIVRLRRYVEDDPDQASPPADRTRRGVSLSRVAAGEVMRRAPVLVSAALVLAWLALLAAPAPAPHFVLLGDRTGEAQPAIYERIWRQIADRRAGVCGVCRRYHSGRQ